MRCPNLLVIRPLLAALILSLAGTASGRAEAPTPENTTGPTPEKVAGQTPETVAGRTVETVAGRTVEQYAEQLAEEDRVVRLRAVKSLGAFGAAAEKPLREALEHDDPAVRYTAAAHLGRIGGEPLVRAAERLAELAEDESSRSVQMAASFALCRRGGAALDKHLPLLIERLSSPERAMACSAAMLIGQLGPAAKDAVEPLQRTYRANRPGGDGDYHLGGAAQNALRKIRLE